ncbi:MAG TPA: universal stress protein [Nitratidesulfovibrio sp.]|jgi:nucleotide-binding universal stress UspA family protein|nr:universal stress protein [Nitratidesulfovibrio sp.]
MIKPSRILLAVDGTQGSYRAARHAALIANLTGAEVILLHCADPHSSLSLPFPAGEAVGLTDFSGYAPPSPHERVGPARDILQDHHVRYMEHTVEGPAAETILGMALREHCDLIVLGRHDTSATDEPDVGRTAEHVVRAAPCTVMVAA